MKALIKTGALDAGSLAPCPPLLPSGYSESLLERNANIVALIPGPSPAGRRVQTPLREGWGEVQTLAKPGVAALALNCGFQAYF
jgi:hypothetical protein